MFDLYIKAFHSLGLNEYRNAIIPSFILSVWPNRFGWRGAVVLFVLVYICVILYISIDIAIQWLKDMP